MSCYTIIQRPSILLVGITCRTTNTPDAGPQDIPKLWGRFYSEDVISQILNKISNEVMALYCDYEGDYTQPYSLVIGCSVSSLDAIPDGMVGKVIPASSYANFRAVGEHPKSLIDTWQHIWQQEEVLKRTYTGDYEVYGDKFSLGSSPEIDVFIAVASMRIVRCRDEAEWDFAKKMRQKYFFDPLAMKDPYTWTFNHQEHAHFILYQEDERIGYAHIQFWPDQRAALRIFVIDEPYRQLGLGSQFLRLCEEELKKQGIRSLHDEARPEAVLFYRKNGYAEMPFNDPSGAHASPQDIALGKKL